MAYLKNNMMLGVYKATGKTHESLQRPYIMVFNTWSEANPGHIHLRGVGEAVKAGIWQAGGTPFEVNGISFCGGLFPPKPLGSEDGRIGMPDMAFRDIPAYEIETVFGMHRFDGMVLISTCDDFVPAQLMAAARINIPSILVLGGCMLPGRYRERDVDVSDVCEAAQGDLAMGKISLEEFLELEEAACPGPGACTVMGTANTMQCLAEALGMSLPGSATTPAVSARLLRIATNAGRQIMELVKRNVKPSDIMTEKSMENMIRVLMALGGSTNGVLHILALAQELNLPIDFDTFDHLSRDTPCLCAVKPNGPYNVIDLHEAGGIPALMNEMRSLLHIDALTVTLKTVGENIASAVVRDRRVIKPLEEPLSREGGIAILRGNLSPEGAVVKQSAVGKDMLAHRGPARVFDSLGDASDAVRRGDVEAGDVIVVRYLGPRGAPGMGGIDHPLVEELLSRDLLESVAAVTDGRMSGLTKGAFIGFVSPEALAGGPLAILQDGDVIRIDIPRRRLDVKISDKEMKRRFKDWQPPKRKLKGGLPALYGRMANVAEKGAGLPLYP